MFLKSFCLLLSATFVFSAHASAGYTHFSSSLSLVQADSTDYETTAPYFQKTFDPAGGLVSTARSMMAPEGQAAAKAQGDLSVGTLKAAAFNAASGVGGYISSFSRVDFGDSFRAVTGSGPFTWSSGSTATFNLHLTGQVNRTGTGQRRNNSVVGLTVLQPGGLDAYARWIETSNHDAFEEWQSKMLGQYFYGLDSDDTRSLVGNLTTFPSNVSIAFNPGGDFDWAATIIADTYVNGDFASANASVNADFFNTAALSYTGPAGTTTLSASGVFPGTSAIPEPTSLALVGLATIGLCRRHRSHKLSR